MKKHLRIASVLLLAASLAGCQGPCQKLSGITAPTLTSGSADFTRFVAVGTSLTAGYQSGGIVDRHQMRSFAALFAQQVGKTVTSTGAGTFSFDAVNGYGIAPLLQLRSLSPPVISNSGLALGSPVNIGQAGDYQNFGVPGAVAANYADSSLYYIPDPTSPYYNPYYALIARHRGTLAQQALRQAPTFLSFEYGINEVLGPALQGSSVLSPAVAAYPAILTGAMNAIHTTFPNTKVVLFDTPDLVALPYFTTFKPYTVSLTTGTVVPLVGLDPAHDMVLLTAQDSLVMGTGFPVGSYNYLGGLPGNGRPLPGSMVLTAAEQTTLQTALAADNAAVDSVANRPWIARVDLNALFGGILANGYTVGTTTYTTTFVTGGLFSLDGVHPTDLGHAIAANAMIDAVNARFGATIPHVDLAGSESLTASSARPAPGRDALKGMELQGLEAAIRTLGSASRY